MVPCSREAAGSWGRCQAGLAKHESAARGAGRASAPPALPTPSKRAKATADGRRGARHRTLAAVPSPRGRRVPGMPDLLGDARPPRGRSQGRGRSRAGDTHAAVPGGMPIPKQPALGKLRHGRSPPGSAATRHPESICWWGCTSEKRSERPPLTVNKRLSDDFLLLLTFDYAE